MARVKLRFNGKNPEAQKAAEKYAARQIRRISKDTKAAIRGVIASGIRDGAPVFDTARTIQKMIGLDPRRAAAVSNFRTELINSGLSLERVNKQVDKYAEKQLRERARSIARTETMGALNTGQEMAWQEAWKDGLIGRDATKEVILTPDEGLCPVCAAMEGVTVSLGKPFETENGDFMNPPFHPNCRCTVALNPGKGVELEEEEAA